MLRYAPLGESCNVSSPRIANPYQSSAYAPVKQASRHEIGDACHMYLRTLYDTHGPEGLIRIMDGDMIRDLCARYVQGGRRQNQGFHISLGFEELAVLLVGIFLLVVLFDN
jgi:hypothetical protein